MHNLKRVAIIGAGVAGLATAKVFLSQNHAVTVFEQGETLGGVWSPGRRYPGLRLQTKRQCYTYSDFPMPADYPDFPTGAQVYDYLVSYARHFGVFERIRTRTEVTNVVAQPGGLGWSLRVRETLPGAAASEAATTEHDFDFVVICNGVFAAPSMPDFPNADEFRANGGIILHSSRVLDTKPMDNRDVVVVGFGKSALDIAEAALATARSCSIVYRRVPWKVPHRVWGRADIKRFILSRFTELWLPHPKMRGAKRLLHRGFRPVVDAFWWGAEQIIRGQLGMTTPELRPDGRLRQAGGCVTLTWDNLSTLRSGRIALHRGSVERFSSTGLELANGRRLPAEIVILATGFQVACPFLEERERQLLFDSVGRVLLYRFLINPDLPNLGFNGYNGVGVCQLSAELGAAWLVRLMEGALAIPTREAMHASIQDEIDLRVKLLAPPHGVGYYVTPFTLGYFDQILSDLGLPPADKHKSLLEWLFDPIDPTDYRDLLRRPQ